jgi:hypothetical protein
MEEKEGSSLLFPHLSYWDWGQGQNPADYLYSAWPDTNLYVNLPPASTNYPPATWGRGSDCLPLRNRFLDDILWRRHFVLSFPDLVSSCIHLRCISCCGTISEIRSYKKSVLRDIDMRFRSVLSFCIWHPPRPISNVKFFKYDFEFPKIFYLKLPHTLGAGQRQALRCGRHYRSWLFHGSMQSQALY